MPQTSQPLSQMRTKIDKKINQRETEASFQGVAPGFFCRRRGLLFEGLAR